MSNPHPAGIRGAVEISGAGITNPKITEACLLSSASDKNKSVSFCHLELFSLPGFQKGIQYNPKLIMGSGA
jgi:hypothetical protein